VTGLPEDAAVARSIRLVVFDLGLQKLRDAGIPAWVLSTEEHPAVSRRCRKLGIPCRQGLADKRSALEQLADEMGVPLGDVAYVGNDINDAECLRVSGIPIVVHDAHPDVLAFARYRTRTAGRFGAVREVCDWLSASVRAPAATIPA